MGIRLNWEVESEQSNAESYTEAATSSKRRRTARLRVLLGALVVMLVCGGLYGAVLWRLRVVEGQLKRSLHDTVQAEVAALRIADRNAFMSVQRSASEERLNAQAANFDRYQQLKTERDVQLTGNVVSLELDGSRGRVQVEEIIDGVPYLQTWFYWRYTDGWRHVDPDYTFWGAVESLDGDAVTVRYRTLDAATAQAVVAALDGWIALGCNQLGCPTPPALTVEIVAQPGALPTWIAGEPTLLQIPSPYVGLARADRPFDEVLQLQVAALLAERLVTEATGVAQPVYPSDAAYLRTALVDWLVGQFIQRDMRSYLIASYAARYPDALPSLVAAMKPDADIRVLTAPAGVTALNALEVDWRDYLTWRLNTEAALHADRDEVNFVSFYDTLNSAATELAFSRFNQQLSPTPPFEVYSVQADVAPDGVPILRAVAQNTNGEPLIVVFRLSDDVWKRGN
jgi:hypothetical protein